jgi:TetR/AcrR family transcriptional repressor of nem operon
VRYAADHKEKTRARILTAAGRRFREKGFAATGVDEVMGAAGLTAGGFYGHFRSKESLLEETLAGAVRSTVERLTAGLETLDGGAWREVARRYLSRSHRKDVASGCVLPALAAEVARQGPAARAAFEGYLREIVSALEERAPGAPGLFRQDRVLATIALFAGGLMLARAVCDEALSDRILRACRRVAVPEARVEESGAPGEEGTRP